MRGFTAADQMKQKKGPVTWKVGQRTKTNRAAKKKKKRQLKGFMVHLMEQQAENLFEEMMFENLLYLGKDTHPDPRSQKSSKQNESRELNKDTF